MKIVHGVVLSLVMILFLAPLIHGQDLSKYRDFSLGMSVADIAKQINKQPTDAIMVHDRPALIQQLTWWPSLALGFALRTEAVQWVRFSFYNGELYKIGVTYDIFATRGLTAGDMIQTMSQNYGIAAIPIYGTVEKDGATNQVLARWQDPQYSVSLLRSSLSNSFGLVLFTKGVAARAEAASAEAVTLEQQEAPEKELARAQKAADDLETQRQENMKAFRP